MSRSVADLLGRLDELDAPDQWEEIEARAVDEAVFGRDTDGDSGDGSDGDGAQATGLRSVPEFIEVYPTESSDSPTSFAITVTSSVAVAAAVLLIVVFLAWSGSDEEPTLADTADTAGPTAPEPGASGSGTAAAETMARRSALAEDMITAYNEGRLVDHLAYFALRGATFWGSMSRDIYRLYAETMITANDELRLHRPCMAVALDTVTCRVTQSDEFHGAGGVSNTHDIVVGFGDDDLIVSYRTASRDTTDGEPLSEAEVYPDQFLDDFSQFGSEYYDFGDAFLTWINRAHPEVIYGGIFFRSPPPGVEIPGELGWERFKELCNVCRLPMATDMAVAVQYVDEFVAQSPDYPLDD